MRDILLVNLDNSLHNLSVDLLSCLSFSYIYFDAALFW